MKFFLVNENGKGGTSALKLLEVTKNWRNHKFLLNFGLRFFIRSLRSFISLPFSKGGTHRLEVNRGKAGRLKTSLRMGDLDTSEVYLLAEINDTRF